MRAAGGAHWPGWRAYYIGSRAAVSRLPVSRIATLLPAMPSPAPLSPPLDVRQLARILSAPGRWHILDELVKGEALPVQELARRTGISREQTSKHCLFMRRLGVVVSGYGRLYSLAPAVVPRDGSQSIRLGLCTIHLRGAGPSAPPPGTSPA